MKFTTTAWTHIRRSPYQAGAAVITMFLTFLLAGIVGLTTITSSLILEYFEGKPQLTAFFSEKATKEQIDGLQTSLQQTGQVEAIKFVSKEEALALYKEQYKNDQLLLELVTADILPASLEVTATEPKFLSVLNDVIKKTEGVEEVVFQKDVVDTLVTWTNAIRFIGGALAILLAIDSLLIIMTVISMKIALKRDEIEIFKLIGASQWYIRMPFLLEGGFYGAVGAFAAWSIIMTGLWYFHGTLLAFLGPIPMINSLLSAPGSWPALMYIGIFFASMMTSGFILGSMGSLVSLSRYIKF